MIEAGPTDPPYCILKRRLGSSYRPGQAVAATDSSAATVVWGTWDRRVVAERVVYNFLYIPQIEQHHHPAFTASSTTTSTAQHSAVLQLHPIINMKWLFALVPLVAAAPASIPAVELGEAPPAGSVH